jgi:hypothetical protein
MNYLQTFWSGPHRLKKKEIYGFTGGWLSAEYHWMSWALSALQARKIFGKIELITDAPGMEMLTGVLELPYTRVSTALDTMPGHYPPDLWSLAKIYAYSLQSEPFLHLDGDLILGTRPGEAWLQSSLLCQNVEKELFFYRAMLDKINREFSYLPAPFSHAYYADREIYSCNAGLFGGTDIGFIQEYCQTAFEFIQRNSSHLRSTDANLNFLYEQYLLFYLAKERGIRVSPYLTEIVEDPLYKELVRFQDIPPAPLIHPVGGFKKLQWVCNSLARRLRDEYPDHYYRIIDVLRVAGVPLRSKIYERSRGVQIDGGREDAGEKDSGEEKDRSGYERTAAALAVIFQKYGEDIRLEPFERECLEEIYRIEATSIGQTRHLFADGTAIDLRYRRDIEMHRSILKLFLYPPEERGEQRVRFNPDALLVPVKWKWVNDRSNKIKDIISLNFSCAEREMAGGEPENRVASGSVAITPSILQLSVNEYYLDELDALIVEMSAEPISLNEILREVQEYFDAADILANYLAYVELIHECVKRLLFAEVLDLYVSN